MSKSKYLLGIIGFATLLLILGASLGPAIAAENNGVASNPPGTEIPIDIITSTTVGTCEEENVFRGTTGWSDEIFVLVIQPPVDQKWISIRVWDCCWYGDYYELWEIEPVMTFIGMTPKVETDFFHGSATYPCPVGNPLHTGTGSVYSDATFTVVKSAPGPDPGMWKFRVRDPFFQELRDEGLDPHIPPWTPAGFYIDFSETYPAPELPIAVPLIVSLMVIALVPIKRKLWKK